MCRALLKRTCVLTGEAHAEIPQPKNEPMWVLIDLEVPACMNFQCETAFLSSYGLDEPWYEPGLSQHMNPLG